MDEICFNASYQPRDYRVNTCEPLVVGIKAEDIHSDMSDEDLENFFYTVLRDDYDEIVCFQSDDLNGFIEWAHRVMDNKKIMPDEKVGFNGCQ